MTDNNRFDDAVERLLRGESPAGDATGLSEDERRMLQMAQLLRGASQQREAGQSGPSASQYAGRRGGPTRGREGVAAPGSSITRRTAVLSGVAAIAASILAGIGIGRETTAGNESATSAYDSPLVGAHGRWLHVADVSELPEGALKPFTSGGLAGVLTHQHGQIRAVSRVCTHMGCLLSYDSPADRLVCPCHGAQFALSGAPIRSQPGYGRKLPELPEIKVRIHQSSIQVWTA